MLRNGIVFDARRADLKKFCAQFPYPIPHLDIETTALIRIGDDTRITADLLNYT
jgi:hypothetical protein